MAGPPTGTVTFLFTDIEGSAALWEQVPHLMPAALARHDAIVRESAVSLHGHVFSTAGDSFAVAFDRAEHAVTAAIAAQRCLQQEPWPPRALIRVRMGVHTGEATEREGNYFGPAVNRAARLMAAAYGEQILLSATTAEVVAEEHGADTRLIDLGEHGLRSLTRPERVFQLVASGLEAGFPPLAGKARLRANLPASATTARLPSWSEKCASAPCRRRPAAAPRTVPHRSGWSASRSLRNLPQAAALGALGSGRRLGSDLERQGPTLGPRSRAQLTFRTATGDGCLSPIARTYAVISVDAAGGDGLHRRGDHGRTFKQLLDPAFPHGAANPAQL